jgi:hypothetical protein
MVDIRITMLGGNCLVQAQGTVEGKLFYFRARWDSWRMNIGGPDVVAAPQWSYEESYGNSQYDAGWMSEDEARAFIQRAAELFVLGVPGSGYRLFSE